MLTKEIPNSSEENLRITLNGLEIKNIEDYSIEIISYSPSDASKNKDIYKIVNEGLIQTLEKQDPGEIIHITGEMRAISDPLHQNVCKNFWLKYKRRVDINFFLPEGFLITGRDILKYNREAWGSSTWKIHLAVFDLIGDGIVNLYKTPVIEKIHFSLFEKKKILLQSMHEHFAHSKDVWILESELLYKKLYPYAKKVQENSEYLQPNIFKRFIFSINSNLALHVLFYLQDNGPADQDQLFREIKKFSTNPEENMKDLFTIGFIDREENMIRITNDGEEYLKLLT